MVFFDELFLTFCLCRCVSCLCPGGALSFLGLCHRERWREIALPVRAEFSYKNSSERTSVMAPWRYTGKTRGGLDTNVSPFFVCVEKITKIRKLEITKLPRHDSTKGHCFLNSISWNDNQTRITYLKFNKLFFVSPFFKHSKHFVTTESCSRKGANYYNLC